MNIDLKSDKLSWLKPVFRRRFTKEETIEVIVPDALPDILRILDTDGTPYLRGKDCEAGRVSVTGLTELTVLYVPESGRGVKKIPVELPFSAACDGEGITPDCLITASLGLVSADARTINPRKLVVRAEVAVDAALYVPESVYNTSPRDREGIYFRSESMTLTLPTAVNEKTFIFTDEAHLPAGAPAIGELLRASVSMSAESVKPVGSRAVIKGKAVTVLLYESRDDGTLCREAVVTPFSQIVETDASGDVTDFELSLWLTGVHISRGAMDDDQGEAVSVEIHAVAQCAAYVNLPVEWVKDAYSTGFAMTPARSALALDYLTERNTVSETLRASVPASGSVGDIHSVSARLTASGHREGPEGPVWIAAVSVTVIYSEASGEILSAARKVEMERPAREGTDFEISFGPDAFTAVGDGVIDVRLPVEITGVSRGHLELERIESVEFDEDEPLDLTALPNVTVTRAGKQSLWELAKTHMSTEKDIREANGIEAGEEPEEGTVLLIPRCG